jgi:hypothetical protein
MKKTVPDEANELRSSHAKTGRAAWLRGDLEAAEASFLAAWQAIPEPRLEYDQAGNMSRSLVMFYRDTKQFDKTYAWLKIMREAYGPQDPSVEFMAGIVNYEAGALDEAFKSFDALFKQYKKRPFEGEDPKYRDFYLQRRKTS